jgi:hypothetical protein
MNPDQWWRWQLCDLETHDMYKRGKTFKDNVCVAGWLKSNQIKYTDAMMFLARNQLRNKGTAIKTSLSYLDAVCMGLDDEANLYINDIGEVAQPSHGRQGLVSGIAGCCHEAGNHECLGAILTD